MHDFRALRKDPAGFTAGLEARGFPAAAQVVAELLQWDTERRQILTEVEDMKRRRNEDSQKVAQRKKAGEDAADLIAETRELGEMISRHDGRARDLETRLQARLMELPNLPGPGVPAGNGEEENVEVRRWGEPPHFDFEPRPHWEIGEQLSILDSQSGAKISGSRFHVLRGSGARLERALINFMVDLHATRHGYTEVWPPYLVRSQCMEGTGQLPKFAEDSYFIPSDDLWLVPTAEVPVTNLHRDEILEAARLPVKYVAYSASFRREAGAAGRDSRGLIRVHQFDKVELVKFTTPETALDELESLRRNAETVLELLELPYRTMEHCTGDLTFASSKSYDPEVWFPAQNTYREISSCSHFGDFQARRANIRYRNAAGKVEFVHTLNGSGLAVGRTLAAILENCQQADGSVLVPPALRTYMGGSAGAELRL